MINEHLKQHLVDSLKSGIRKDGRRLDELREITIERGVSSTAHGSARLRAGKAEIIAGVKIELGTPYPDRPDDGSLMVAAEMMPISHRKFEPGPPGMDSIEVARVIDRTIRESETIDTKKLCIKSGEKVWMVIVDLMPVTYDGNMISLGALAAMAALQDAKMPAMDKNGNPLYEELTKESVPIDKLPVAVTVYKFGDKLLVDPTEQEEIMADARLTIATLEDGNLCALQKGGEEPLTHKEISDMVDMAKKKSVELRKVLND